MLEVKNSGLVDDNAVGASVEAAVLGKGKKGEGGRGGEREMNKCKTDWTNKQIGPTNRLGPEKGRWCITKHEEGRWYGECKTGLT
jgi:hypothetical protein